MNETVRKFEITKAPYSNMNAVKVSVKYAKNYKNMSDGYYVVAELIQSKDGMIGKCFSQEYYKHDGDLMEILIEAKRRSEKKRLIAMNMAEKRAEEFAELFIKHINEKLGTDVKLLA